MKFEFPTIEIKHFELEDILTASAAEPTACWDDFSNCPLNTSGPACGGGSGSCPLD